MPAPVAAASAHGYHRWLLPVAATSGRHRLHGGSSKCAAIGSTTSRVSWQKCHLQGRRALCERLLAMMQHTSLEALATNSA